MLKRYTSVLIVLSSFVFSNASAQIGGNAVFSFLNIPASARIAAMGGTFISVKDDDLNCGLQNPAALNPAMDKYLSFSAVSYPAGIRFGDVAFAKDFKKLGTFDIWMHYADYGDFKEADETGMITGNFTAADYALSIGWGYQLNKLFSIGANLKGIYSDYYLVNSTGLAADVSAMLYDSASGWTATILARNIGSQLKPYTEGNREPLPMEVATAFSKKFAHMPARLNLTIRHLEKLDLTFIDPNDQSNYDPITGSYTPEEASLGTKIERHVNIGVEILLSKNFNLRASYGWQRRQEMLIDSRPGTLGLSLGAGLKISKFILSYGWAKYHLAGSANHFSIAVNLGEFSKKK